MFKIEELSGSLIKSGRFKEAIPLFNRELHYAIDEGCILLAEMFELNIAFNRLLLVPDAEKASVLGERMIKLGLRLPNYVKPIAEDDFDKNVKASREAK